MSHSTVQLPVPSYQQRLQRMASELASQYLPAALQRWKQQHAAAGAGVGESRAGEGGSGGGSGGGDGATSGASAGSTSSVERSGSRDEALLQEIQRYLYEVQGFRVPGYGRSNLPDRGALVWEFMAHGWPTCSGWQVVRE